MNPTVTKSANPPHDHLLQYAHTVAAMHKTLQRIFANKKAICENLTRTAMALRTMSTAHEPQAAHPPRPDTMPRRPRTEANRQG